MKYSERMTEEQIELWVEKQIDKLDRMLGKGQIDQDDYDGELEDVHRRAEREYARRKLG